MAVKPGMTDRKLDSRDPGVNQAKRSKEQRGKGRRTASQQSRHGKDIYYEDKERD